MPSRLAEGASSDLRGAAAEDGAAADGAVTAERGCCAAATSSLRSAGVAVAVEYSLSSRLVPRVAYRMPERRKDAADNAAEVSNRARDSWWTPRSDCSSLHRPAMLPASVRQANSELVSAAAVAVDPRSMMRAS